MLRLKAPPGCRFVAGPDASGWMLREGARGQRALPLERTPFVIGRALDCSLVLPDSPELRRSTSRWHCHVAQHGGESFVSDGGPDGRPSRSGTFCSGRRVDGKTALKAGMNLRVGPWVFALERAPAPRLRWAAGAQDPAEDGSWEEGSVVAGIYEVVELLGAGGMGEVYRVRHRGWDVELAVKRPNTRLLEASGGASRFVREAETWVNLPLHPNIVTAYYVRSLSGVPMIFSECVEGGDLRGWLAAGRPGGVAAGLDAAIQVCWGMAVAHAKGLVHRDLKPANVLVGVRGEAKVTDFGLVKLARETTPTPVEAVPDGTAELTRFGAVVGTPPYMPPEQWKGTAVGPAADVYAFGAMLLELLCGRRPFVLPPELEDAGGAAQLAAYRRMHLAQPPPDPRSLAELPTALAALIVRCLDKDPARRPGDFDGLAVELAGFYKEASGRAYERRNPGALEGRAVELNNRALSMLDLGDEAGARRLLGAALKADPQHPEAVYNSVALQWKAGEIDDVQAVKRMEEALGAQKDGRTAAHLLGLLHLRRGDPASAEGVLAEAGAGPDVLLALGDARMAQGRAAEAEAAYSSARAAAPDSVEAERRVAAALAAQGKREEAASFWGGKDFDASSQRPEFTEMRCLRAFPGHRGYVQCVAAVPDGKRAVSAGLDKAIRLWDLESGRCERVMGGLENTPFLAITPDGRFALAQGIGGDLSFWDLATGECAQRIEGHAKNISALALTPDGRRGVTGDEDGTVVLWDFTAASPPGAAGLKELIGASRVRALAIAPDGSRVVAGDDDGRVLAWDARSGALLHTLSGHAKSVVSVACAADGRQAVSAGWDGPLRVWDLERGVCSRVLEGHSVATAAAISPDGTRLLSGGMDKAVRLWDLASGACLRTFTDHSGSIYAVAFTPDGRALSGGSDREMRLWSVASPLPALPPAFAHFVSSEQAAAFKQRAADLHAQARSDAQEGAWARADGVLRQARALPGYEKDPGLLELADRLALKGIRIRLASQWVHRTLRGHAGPVAAASVSDDEHLALSGGADGSIRLWALDSGALLCVLEGHPGAVAGLTFLPEASRALSAGDDGALLLWDILSRRLLKKLEGHGGRVNAVAAAPDGRRAVSAGTDGTLRLWDLESGACLRALEGHRGGVLAAAVSPEGACAASAGDDNAVRLWDLAAGRCLRVLEGHDYSVHSLAFAPDGRTLLSGGGDQTIRLWEAASGACRSVLEQTAAVRSLGLFPGGRHALCSLRGSTSVRIWPLAGAGRAAVLDGHSRPVSCAAASASGRFAVTGGEDGLVQVWRLDWEHEFPAVDGSGREVEAALKVFLEVRGGVWGEREWKALFYDLGVRGFGSLGSEALRERLEDLTRRWPEERGGWLKERYGAEAVDR